MGEVPSAIGAYRIVRRLGEGGMGTVYEAIHETIERRVAIKVLHVEYARSAELSTRFFNEARAVNRVAHPGVVQISDYGQLPDGTSYIVMEFLEGESLAKRLQRLGGGLPTPEAVHLGWQLADTLAAAHEKGIVHRDLKPENVMIVPDPHTALGERAKLLDFGVAKVSEQGGIPRPKTKIGQVLGTPTYMSPEQCAGSAVDEKTDSYALGVVLFQLLARRPPFQSDDEADIMRKHILSAPPSLRQFAPEISPSLMELVHRLLAKNKEARPFMRQAAATLARFADEQPLPRHSSHDQTLRAVDAALPDETIRVGERNLQDLPPGRGAGKAAGKAARGAGVQASEVTVYVGKRKPKSSALGSSAGQSVRPEQRMQRTAGILASALCFAGLGIWLALRSLGSASVPQPTKSTASTMPAEVSAKRVIMRIETEPAGAGVVRVSDGQALGTTPWEASQPAADGQLSLRLQREGYESHLLSLPTNVDQRAIVHLLPRRPPPDPSPSHPAEKSRLEHPKAPKATPVIPSWKSGQPKIVD